MAQAGACAINIEFEEKGIASVAEIIIAIVHHEACPSLKLGNIITPPEGIVKLKCTSSPLLPRATGRIDTPPQQIRLPPMQQESG